MTLGEDSYIHQCVQDRLGAMGAEEILVPSLLLDELLGDLTRDGGGEGCLFGGIHHADSETAGARDRGSQDRLVLMRLNCVAMSGIGSSALRSRFLRYADRLTR